MNLHRHLLNLLLGFVIAGLVVSEVLIGGVRLVYALPALVIFSLAGLASVALWKTPLVHPRRYAVAAALGFAGYIVCRALTSPVPYLARPDFFTACGALIVYLVSANFLGATRPRFSVILVLMLLAVAQVCVGIWQFKDQANFMLLPWIFRPDYGFKASGFFISPHHFAALLGMLGVLSLSICCWGRISLSARAFAFYGFIVCLTGTALTGSRVGYISIAAGLLFFTALSIYLSRRFDRPHFFGLAIATALLLTAVVALVLKLVVQSDVYETRLRHVHEPGGKGRLLAPAALAQHRVSPLVGTGAGTFLYFGRQLRDPALQNDPQHAHNESLELLAEYGWVGFALGSVFLLAHAVAAISGIRSVLQQKLKPSATVASNELAMILGASSALCVVLVHSLADGTFHLPALALFTAFLFSVLANPTVETSDRRRRAVLPWWSAGLGPAAAAILLVAAVWRWPGELFAECARLALRDGDAPAALDFAQRAIARDHANADAFYYAGEALHYRALAVGDGENAREFRRQAAAAFTAGLQQFPQDVRLLLKLGRTLDDLDQAEAATAIFQRALAASPASGIVQACVGLHWHRRGDFGQAAGFYHAAQALGETQISTAGLSDLERDVAYARENDAFADLLPDRVPENPAPLSAK